jgi:hypothetical protein
MFQFDKTRLDLAREFRANPFGEHSPDLQYLLNLMRRPGARWTLAVVRPGGREPPRRTNVVFTDLKEAEWHVFKLRWAALSGEDLPLE